MKPWPKELQEKYPQPIGRWTERPWWVPHGNGLCRRDGFQLLPEFTALTLQGAYEAREGLKVRAAQIDQEQSLPHPGFRVGQVWATPQEADEFLIRVVQAQATGSVVRHWYMDFWYSEEELQAELSGSFLLADPCCPWLAPWSPPETRP